MTPEQLAEIKARVENVYKDEVVGQIVADVMNLLVENERLRKLALKFARRSFKIVVSSQECHIPLTEWDAFRDSVQELVKQEREEVEGE